MRPFTVWQTVLWWFASRPFCWLGWHHWQWELPTDGTVIRLDDNVPPHATCGYCGVKHG